MAYDPGSDDEINDVREPAFCPQYGPIHALPTSLFARLMQKAKENESGERLQTLEDPRQTLVLVWNQKVQCFQHLSR